MLEYLKALLFGVAASVVFWFVNASLLKVGDHARALGMLIAFVVVSAVSILIAGRRDAGRRRVASGRRIGGDADDRIGQITVRGDGDADVLSGNVVKGNSNTSVDRIDVG